MGQIVGVRDARSPDDAVSDYLLAQGYAAEEFERVAPGALSWRGAVFSAESLDPVAADVRLVESTEPRS